VVRWLNGRKKAGRVVLSCDVPSGHGSGLAVHPTTTVALHRPQPSLTKANAGRIVVAPIGIPARALDIGFGDAVLGYPMPGLDSHKGDNGTVLVVAGSIPLLGAPHYVSLGAYRAGADLIHIAAALPPAGIGVLRSWGPEAIVHQVGRDGHLTSDALPAIEGLLGRFKALVIGPGLGSHPSTRDACRRILSAAATVGVPTVVDADGLDALDDALLARHGAKMVLTPHHREFEDLAGTTATRSNVQAYARAHGVTVLRKGATDVVSDGKTTRQCSRGHPTMTVGGTGDVLAGVVAALLAKGAAPFDAACAASYISKAAGEVAAAGRSFGATASDVAEAVPAILVRIEAARQAKA
jgi:NAD(P)H-hydrate epimerase